MSHFHVMVIGPDPAKQLAPYHEFECTGDDNEFVQDVDVTQEQLDEYEKYKQRIKERQEKALAGEENDTVPEEMSFFEFVTDYHGMKFVPFGKKPDLEGDHKYRYALLNESVEIDKIFRRTNPEARWDWYILGGRFSGMLTTKRGKKVDQALKGDIDLVTMRKEARREAEERYDSFAKCTQGLPWPESWTVVLHRFGPNAIEGAREFYAQQPFVKAMRNSKEFSFFSKPEDFGQDRQAYIDRRVSGCGVPFAFVKDAKWVERGEMGWFGMSFNEKDKDVWDAEFWKMFDALPDDTLISMIDCHI